MTPIDSLPFTVIVDAKKETSQFFQGRNAQRLVLLPFCSQRKSQYVGWRRNGRWKSLRVGRRLRAEASGSTRGGDGEKSSEDSLLDATIEKGKKMLDRQSKLLQQIAERRKLVSSIKDSVIDEEEDMPKKSLEEDVLDRGSNGSIVDLNPASTTAKNAAGHQNASFPLPNYAPSNREEIKEISKAIDKIIDEGKKEDGEGLTPDVAFSGAIDRGLDEIKMECKESSTSKIAFSYVVGTGPDEIGKEAEESLATKRSPNIAGSSKCLEDVGPKVVGDIVNSVPVAIGSNTGNVRHEDRKQQSSLDNNIEAENPAAEDPKPPPLAGANVMNVILVAAECAPWIKTGGLGDVAGSLPKALARRGHRVMVVVPRYGNYAEGQDMGIRRRYKVDGQDHEVSYFQAYIDGVDFVFIDSPMFRHMEDNIYGGNRMDILKRMVLFCKAAVEVPWYVPCGGICYGDGNLVFIANDWHTALLPVYLKAYYRDNDLMKYTRSVLVIHNIAHQGRGPVEDFVYVGLPEHYLDLFKMYDPLGGDHFNIFAAGLKTADRIVTVSHGYSWELKTSEGGWGLHNIINESDWKFRGIVNGIDTKEWNPQLDVHLTTDGYKNYSLDTLHTGKPQCKAALQKELGLPVRDDVPVIGFIGRLDHQKGVDLIAKALPWIVGQDVQLVMLGTGRPDLEQMLRQFESQYQDKVRGWVGFSVRTAHRITAGADILLMPSRFEPCGLNQLYAMNYGTVPVVHAVGGLRDTVQPFDPFNESGLGWTFDSAESNKLINALGNCLLTYRQYKNSWEGLQRRGMTQDLSWDRAAENYEEVLVAAKYQW